MEQLHGLFSIVYLLISQRPQTMTKTNGMGQAEVLTPEQLDLLIENLPEGTHRTVACVMRYCASRVSETLQLRFSDINESSILFRCTNTKTKQSRSIPLHPKLKAILAEWRTIWHKYPLKARKVSTLNELKEYVIPQPTSEDYVFKGRKKGTHLTRASVDKILRRTLKELEIHGASTHSWRRTQLSNAKDSGMALPDLMAISGHTSLNSLQRYLHTTEKQKKEVVSCFK